MKLNETADEHAQKLIKAGKALRAAHELHQMMERVRV